MTSELLDLWITRLRVLEAEPPSGAAGNDLAGLIAAGDGNVVAFYQSQAEGRANLHKALARCALDSSGRVEAAAGLAPPDPLEGWLVVDLPIPGRASSTEIVHRMISRLYFAAVLHGLAERPGLREAVQALRLSFLQTRGKVTTGSTSSRTEKAGVDLGVSFDLTQPITAKLTAAEELEVAECFSAEMERLGLYEAEDQLLFDLQLLAQLQACVDRYAAVREPLLPRWEQVRGYFRAAYGTLGPKTPLRLRPVIVLEAQTLTAVTSLLVLLADAASLATAQGAQLVVLGGPLLARVWVDDEQLGHPLFRHRFRAHRPNQAAAAPAQPADPRATLERILVARPDLPAEVRDLLERAWPPTTP